MLKLFQILLSVILILFNSLGFAAGISLGVTRLIYDGSKKEASTMVKSTADSPTYLVQTWVDDANGSSKTPFLATPPIARLENGKENLIRILKIAELPNDRETVYWLNVKAIPPKPDQQDNSNSLQIAIKNRLKLIYRPRNLVGSLTEAPTKLTWNLVGDNLVIKNPSAYTVTIASVYPNQGQDPIYPIDFIPAKDDLTIKTPPGINKGQKLSFTIINDYGGESATFHTIVQ